MYIRQTFFYILLHGHSHVTTHYAEIYILGRGPLGPRSDLSRPGNRTRSTIVFYKTISVDTFVWCLTTRVINPCGSLASDGIKLNMMWMEKVNICKIK